MAASGPHTRFTAPHVCSPGTCVHRSVFGNLFVCASSGAEHLCDRNCRYRTADLAHGGTRCALSGLLFAFAASPAKRAAKRRRTPSPTKKKAAFRPLGGLAGDGSWGALPLGEAVVRGAAAPGESHFMEL